MATQNHPLRRVSTSSVFYEPRAGFVERMAIAPNPVVEIGNDVWIGDAVRITPGCARIQDGAIIGAGAVVTHDVPAFTINVGIPARVLRQRFTDETIAALQRSCWWCFTPSELAPLSELLTKDLAEDGILEFCRRINELRGPLASP